MRLSMSCPTTPRWGSLGADPYLPLIGGWGKGRCKQSDWCAVLAAPAQAFDARDTRPFPSPAPQLKESKGRHPNYRWGWVGPGWGFDKFALQIPTIWGRLTDSNTVKCPKVTKTVLTEDMIASYTKQLLCACQCRGQMRSSIPTHSNPHPFPTWG